MINPELRTVVFYVGKGYGRTEERSLQHWVVNTGTSIKLLFFKSYIYYKYSFTST